VIPSEDSLLYNKLKTFDGMSEEHISRIFEIATMHQYTKGANLLEENQLCKQIYFIEKGFVRTFTIHDGNEINLDFVFENHFATSLKSLRQASPSDIFLQTGEPTTAYAFEKDNLFALYKQSSIIESFGRSIIEELLLSQEEHTAIFKLLSPKERYLLLQKNHPEMIQRISGSHLSSYLGMARETLSRVRKTM
jgi:CRP-like cAMP-binding protein